MVGMNAALAGILLAAPLARPQAPAFEVAAVKPSGTHSVRGSSGGPGSRDPERFSFTSARLSDLLFLAHGLIDDQQISGPGWMDTQRYDVLVKIPPGTDKKQFQLMLQNLLAERFKLVVHHEAKELPVYELVVGKTGSKLRESGALDATGNLAPDLQGRDQDGFPILPAGRPNLASGFGPGRHCHMTAREQKVSALAEQLSRSTATGRRVIDKTGLPGRYDFKLAWDAEQTGGPPSASDDAPLPSIFDAVQQQLGLKLVPAKAWFDIVIVDHAEKIPTEN